MNRTKQSLWRVRATAVLGFALIAAIALVAPTAHAQTGTRPGHYSGNAYGDLLSLTVGSFAGTPFSAIPTVANVGVSPTVASADSDGFTSDTAHKTAAKSANLSPADVLDNLNLNQVIPLSTSESVAPPSSSDSANFLAIPADPLLNVSVSDAATAANWAGDGVCVAADQPLSQAVIRTGQLYAVDTGNTPLGKLVSIDNAQNGAVTTKSTMSLPSIAPVPGMTDPRAIQSEQFSQTLGLDVLGTNITIQVIDPSFTATATGLDGGAKIHYTAPVLVINGNEVSAATIRDNLTGPLLDALKPLLGGLADAGLLEARIEVGNDPLNVTESADGTTASADAELAHLTIDLLPTIGGNGVRLVDLSLVPMHVEAHAPLGGIECGNPENPIGVNKTSDKETVAPDETFTYTIHVSNSSTTCTLTNVSASDVITGPEGSTIVSTDPPASSATFPNVTWNSLPDIPPGGSYDLKVTVKVPASAQNGDNYDDTATVNGVCGGLPYSTPFTLNDIPRVVIGVLPRTGGDSTMPLIGAAMLLVGAFGLRRLRRI